MPGAIPRLIRPSEAKGKIRFAAVQDLIKNPLQNLAAITKPVVPVAESFNAVGAGQIGLGLPDFGHPQIVKPQISGQVGLLVAGKKRLCLGDVGPFGKSIAPPKIIFRNRMVLRQIKCYEPGFYVLGRDIHAYKSGNSNNQAAGWSMHYGAEQWFISSKLEQHAGSRKGAAEIWPANGLTEFGNASDETIARNSIHDKPNHLFRLFAG
jgi:hypothetical protein